jgi:hypothetical protein
MWGIQEANMTNVAQYSDICHVVFVRKSAIMEISLVDL